ncbi:succinate-semialdehyde dehydrogenase/glutarate-semialdehyde dehydrogenase [Actinoplanes campanulatus]|uniref:Succinate-semialdehyde dehydrogenase/glutarate-semialdehyde dehydrogenase n=1 Tax=Actinoplanes campanulatus TaxID=113559 RepID=A0A7W5AJE8_9ACTN|nr:aldehyde dehydrogenase family protein [Actinoplanes campanulatus]MBB3096854.1 succinate-semialdehyde dehydrogenase/glutarate-semialdehyde dehydrogenase [Actinoplanes campanulatus]GGN44537.1 succinate-semialdehyde dehydrogenase [Actinoplanes campanulatus]GID37398.1 succinate-semialdehyde dehydrogenase [Actinoplanes campanulatus]
MHEVEQLIDGRWAPGTGGRTLTVTGPRDDRPVARVPVASEADVAAAVRAARAAAPEWARTAPAARAAALHAAANAIEAAAGELAEIMAGEMGKPVDGARDSIAAGVGTLRQYAELGPTHRGRSLAGDDGAIDLMAYRPRGVVAVITPWNDPVAVSCGLLGAALVTGNTVAHKPSERTPATGWRLARLFAPHLPQGVLNVVHGDAPAGAALAGGAVDVVAHVGSTATGRSIAAACARTGAKALLENGGSDPLIVDAGVDPVWAAGQAALGAFANSGQICVAVERIYVHREVAEPFVEALAAEAETWGKQIGPLVDRRLRDTVHQQVRAAVRDGATLVCGGAIPDAPGAHYPPTVLTGCTDDMPVMREETFGPVAPVLVVDSFEEALERAADSPYGLAATVLTPSMSHAQRAWRELPAGTIKVNAVFGGAPGGAAHPRRGSGQGFGYGPELLDEMTVTTVVHLEAPPTGW